MNKKINRILLMILFCSLVSCLLNVAYSQEVKEISNEVLEFAKKSLQSYVKNAITEKNYMKLGFKMLDEAQRARLGEPYRVMIIGLKDLKAYEAGRGAKRLLIDAKTIWFPVMIENETRTKLEIIQKEGKWIAGEFGRIKIVKKIAMVKNRLPELLRSKQIESPYVIMLLKIPALYATFFYIESSRGEFMIPAMIQPQRYNLQNAQIYTADEALSKLKEFAQKIDEKKIG